MKVIFNGELVDVETVPASHSGWLTGAGIFETIKTVGNAPYALGLHLSRAQGAAEFLNITMPSLIQIKESLSELFSFRTIENGMLRISFANSGDWLAVHMPYVDSQEALNLRIHPQRIEGNMCKQFPYNGRLEIMEQAKAAGFDDAITVNAKGHICEGSVTNLIVRIGDQWFTPPVEDQLLPGIMRQIILENQLVRAESIPVDQISQISSAFFVSSLRIAQPISAIEGRQLQVSHGLHQEIHALARKYSVG